MNINKLALVVPAVLVLAGCTLLPQGPITGTTEQKALKLAQIIETGGSANCKITNLTDQTETQIIVKGKKMKFIGTDLGEGKKGTMLNDTEYTYFWTEGEKTGMKTKNVVPTPNTALPTGQAVAPTDPEQEAMKYEDETKYKMDCSAVNVTDADFAPPADVNFSDLSKMMEGLPSAPKSMPSLPSGMEIPAIPDGSGY